MTKQEIKDLENYIFIGFSNLYHDTLFQVDFSKRLLKAKHHQIALSVFGKYNNYFTIRPSLSIVSDEVCEHVCKIFNKKDNICYYSLLDMSILGNIKSKFLKNYQEGFMFHKVSDRNDVHNLISDHQKFMELGGLAFIEKTDTLEEIEIFLNEKISNSNIQDLYNPNIKSELRKFYKDPRIIRSALITKYIVEKGDAIEIESKFKVLFEGMPMVIKLIDQISDYFLENDVEIT